MLTGRVPFNSTSEYELMRRQIEDAPAPPRSHAPHIPLSVEQSIMRSLAKKREARFQSASEFRATLISTRASLVTKPLADPATRAGGFAAPATVMDRAMQAPPSGDTLKATRLSGDQTSPLPTFGEMKATRLGQTTAAAQSNSGNEASPGTQTATAQGSFLSKLNWKHFTAAGAVFLVILAAVIAGAFVLRGGGAREEVNQPSTPAPSEAQSPSPSPAQSEASPVPAQSVQPPPTQPAPVESGTQSPVGGSNANGASSGRTRAGAGKTADAPPPGSPEPSPQTPPPTQPAPVEEKAATTKPEPEKKEPEKKPEEKKKGLFGKLKDAITGGDKKKDPKKP